MAAGLEKLYNYVEGGELKLAGLAAPAQPRVRTRSAVTRIQEAGVGRL
jgi:hypothetical protein